MKKKLNKNSLNGFINYGIILVVYLVLQFLIGGVLISYSIQNLLVNYYSSYLIAL